MTLQDLKQPETQSQSLPKRPAPQLNTVAVALTCFALFAFGVWSLIDLRINVASLIDSVDNAVDFVSRTVPLDFPPIGETALLVGETLAIVFLATLLSVILSIPTAIFAAYMTTSGPLARGSSRAFIVLMRAVPDLILAIIFFRMFGLGALPGIFAMGLHSIGMVAKLYADAIESLAPAPMEAIASAGGTRNQQIMTGIIQPLLPQLIATALHRFDINLRTSVILGYVGVGGVGLAIADAMRTLNYQRGMALAVIVLVLCIAVELLSGAIRNAIMHGDNPRTGWLERAWDSVGSPVTTSRSLLTATPPWSGVRLQRFSSWSLVVILTVVSLWVADVSVSSFFGGLLKIPSVIDLFFPPSDNAWDSVVEGMLVTVQIGFAATLLGAILAIPIGVLAARNVMPNPLIHKTFRVVIVLVRGIPELILAIIFVVITGLGGVAGTLALAVGAVGLLSKLVADSLEETDVRVQDALSASGATRWQVFFAATVRQAGPAFVAHIMYLLDTNIRSATLLGIVGAGGVGFILLNAARVQQFGVVTTVLLLILAVVLTVEALAVWIRRAVS